MHPSDERISGGAAPNCTAMQHRAASGNRGWFSWPAIGGPGLYASAMAIGLASGCGTETPVLPSADSSTGQQDNATGAELAVDSAKSDAATDTGPAADGADSAGLDSQADTGGDASVDPDSAGSDTLVDSADDSAADTAGPVDAAKDGVADTQVSIIPGLYPGNCTASSDCLNPCVTPASSCDNGKCKFKAQDKACLVESDGGMVECIAVGGISKSKPCLACQGGATKAVLSANTWLLPMDAATESVTVKDANSGGIIWNYTDKKAISGGKSLWFGDPAKGTYANNKAVAASATTVAVKIPNLAGIKPKLSFWLWLETEQTLGDDLLSVQVLENDVPLLLWSSDAIDGSTHGAWQRISVDLAAWADKSVQFQLVFATKDGTLNAYAGAFVDDLAVATGCCAGDDECADGNACTTDICSGDGSKLPVCKNAVKPGCCSSNSECDDKKPCTFDLCSGPGGACSYSALPGCCLSSAGCDDQNACTDDICPAPGGQCQYLNKCCKSDTECATTDPCKKGVCASGQCSYSETCCIFNDECDDFNPCSSDACDKGKCVYTSATVPGCCSPQVLNSLFAGSDEGWSFKSTHPTLKWAYKDGTVAKSGPGALKMGDPAKDINPVPFTNPVFKVTASSPIITVLPGKETTLSFWTYHVNGNGTSYTFRLFILLDGVETVLASYNFATMNNVWKQTIFDLTPLGGKSFELNFEVVATTSAGIYQATGVYVDDVVVSCTCQGKKCTSAASCTTAGFNCAAGVCTDGLCGYANSCCATDKDCNDSSLCTTDTCLTTKKCSFAAIKGCCMGPGDCNDGNACTQDMCPGAGGQCSNPNVAGCCLGSSFCDDKNTCTLDKCVAYKCVNEISCCTADKDCADGETKCTIDTCVAGKCQHKPTGAPGCCEPDVYVNDFDQGALKDITIVNSAGVGKGWQINATPPGALSKTPPAVLWYGDPGKGTFDMGATNGKATTGKIFLPAVTPSKLTFSLLMDTESGGKGSYDDMYVYVYVGAQKLPAWDKGSGVTPNKWYEVTFDLATYAGQEIQVEFYFNTLDSVGNNGKGVYIDDLKITTSCGG
ncbi:MAG: hypothetical protein EXR77_06335 [Myxococcales bacterium]|nr:hypothetical protein [Myxococcales bacterium]